MAFPVPSHLPRKKDRLDVSTKILTKISDANKKSLNAKLASSWVAELDESITQLKERIDERISNDFPLFNEQLLSAKTIQTRLQSLTSEVDRLSSMLSDSESGLIPTLITSLTKHAKLAQETLNANIKYDALSYLVACKSEFARLTELVHAGRLPDAVRSAAELNSIVQDCPAFLSRSAVMQDLKRSFEAMKARTEEQLNEAYTRSIIASPSELVIRPSVQVRQSETVLKLPSVLLALSQASLSTHLATLRRDITTHFIDFLARQPASVNIVSEDSLTGTNEYRLAIFPSPPSTSDLPSRIENMSTLLSFLNMHIFPCLPPSQHAAFPQSLAKPLRNALLNYLLIPSLPSSIELLSDFLALVTQACHFEAQYIGDMLGDGEGEQDIKAWGNGVGGHYERKRRMELLEAARVIVTAAEDESDTFRVELQFGPDQSPELEPTPEAEKVAVESLNGHAESTVVKDDTAWGFDEEEQAEPKEKGDDESGWDFDDDTEPEPAQVLNPAPSFDKSTDDIVTTLATNEEDDAWDLNNNDASETLNGDDSFDDPWGDPWEEDVSQNKAQANAAKSILKPAKRLEKLTSKGKGVSPDLNSPSLQSPLPVAEQPPMPLAPVTSKQPKATPPPRLSKPSAPVEETSQASGRAKQLVQHVEDVLSEGSRLASSGILSSYSSQRSPSGSTTMQAAPLTLDLYRAIYPVMFAGALDTLPKRSMRFSNDCMYLSGEVDRIVKASGVITQTKEKLQECKECLKFLGETWFERTIDRQCHYINDILDGAEGFVETTNQDRFDQCENAVNQVLVRIRQLAQQWKPVLSKSRYYEAVGSVVDSALSRILADILALPDITAEESNRLSELCRILNALEGLFVEDVDQPSFVVSYVPLWLKYSYLSELLEASIADISYLFEEGALVDFEIEELVKLVQALFADTPLRTNAINKLLRGHPVQA